MSLALAMGGAPVVATVAQPALGHVFLAVHALGATLDGMPLELPRGTGLAGRTVLTVLDAHRRWPGMDRFWDRLAQQHATVRVVGSGTLALTGVAAGWAAGGVVHSFNPVDHLAGVLIAREAGAEVVGLDGVPRGFPIVGEPLVVAAPGLSAPWRRRCWRRWTEPGPGAAPARHEPLPGSGKCRCPVLYWPHEEAHQ